MADNPFDQFDAPAESNPFDQFDAGVKPLTATGPNDKYGVEKNIATGALKNITHIPGIFGDVGELGRFITSGVQSMFSDRTAEQIRADQEKLGQRTREKARTEEGMLGRVASAVSGVRAPAGADIYEATVKPSLGEYEPQTALGRIGQAAIESAMPGPSGKAKIGTRILAEAPGLMQRGLEAAGRYLPVPVLGGIGGASGQGARELGAGPYTAALVGAAVPVGVAGAASAARRAVPTVTREGQARTAGKLMREHATDPAKALETAEKTYASYPPQWGENLPDPSQALPSLSEATGDRGLASGERAARLTDVGTDAALMERQQARNEARKDYLKTTVEPGATGEEPGQLFRQQAEDLDKRIEQALPDVGTNEELGKRTRAPILAGREAVEDARSKLYDAMEEHFGDNTLLPNKTRENAGKLNEYDPAYAEPPTSLNYIKKALAFPEVVTFGNMRAYLKSINKALQQARTGTPIAADIGELKFLKAGVMDDLENAIANQHKYEQEAVARGELSPDATIESKLQRQRADWYAGKMAEGQGVATSTGTNVTAGPRGISSASGTKGPRGGIAGGTGSDSGVPGNAPNMDPRAAAALTAANDAQRYLGQTYRQGTVAQLLKENGFKGAWNLRDSSVPRTAFPGGPDGYTVTKSVLDAGGPKVVPALTDTAVMSLREAMQNAGGHLNPQKLQAWKNKYRTSLNALDEVSPGFSSQFDNLASTQSTMASKFVGAANAGEAQNFMGQILRKPDGASTLQHLVKEAGNDPAVVEGFKKLTVDHMIDEATKSAGASGDWGSHLKNQIAAYRNKLPALFAPDQMKVMERLADDATQAQQHVRNLKGGLPGSPTTQNFQVIKQRLTPMAPLERHAGWPWLALWEGTRSGFDAFLEAMAGVVGLGAAQRVVHNLRARGVNGVQDMYRAGMADPQIGMRMLRHGVETPASPSWFNRSAQAILASPLYERPVLDQEERKGHASGGKVGVDHEKAAKHMVGLVERARKMETARTKPLLKTDDNTVAHALALANAAI